MAELHGNNTGHAEPHAHTGELDVAQSTGSLELTRATGEGYEKAEKLPDDERLRSIHERTLRRADMLFADVATALHQPHIDTTPEDIIERILAEADRMETWTDWYIRQTERSEGRAVTKDEADLAYLDTISNNAADNRAADVKHAKRKEEKYRPYQNKEAGTARSEARQRAEGPVMSRRLNEYFGETLVELSRRLQEKRENQGSGRQMAA